MSNKKFISYFHMLYTGLKGTAGAYMAALLVLLSAFAATGAEKTPTTDANRQALPMKAAVKKKSEITKKPPVDTKKTLSSPSDLKVANIVILNNTGLPDDQIFFNLMNTVPPTATSDEVLNCPPEAAWTNLFQSYGGTVGTSVTPAKPATKILRNSVPMPTNQLTYNVMPTTGNPYSSVRLADMRGSVLSNATSTSPIPTSSNTYWNGAIYKVLVPHNPDSSHVGTFPTISMGLFGACTNQERLSSLKMYAGRIAISAFEPFKGDNFDTTATAPAVPPYVLIEGSIFPTDNSTPTNPLGYPSQASNLDLSFVDQISIAANIELWAPESANGPFVPNPKGWLAGNSVTTADNTIDLFQTYNATPLSGIKIQSVEFTPTDSNDTYDLFYAFTKNMTSPSSSFVSPYNQFLTNLISNSGTSSGTYGNLVLKSAGTNINIGTASRVLEFGDCNYGNQLGYNFFTYFVDMSATTKTPWSKIIDWYATDSSTTQSSAADPTQFLSYTNSDPTQNITDYMLMLGTFSPGSAWSLSPCNGAGVCNTVSGGPGGGPLSIQLNANSIEICGVVNAGANILVHCGTTPGEIQSCGMNNQTDQMGGIFTTSTGTSTVTGPLGINFQVTAPSYLLQEFDLSVGKTTAGLGTLEVDLVDVNGINSTNLVKVTINIPQKADEGLAASVVDNPLHNPTLTAGFNPANATNGWPLQIDWQKLTCKYNGNLLSPTFYYWKTTGWEQITAATADYITACTLSENPHAYRLNINGTNLTVALTNLNPNGTAGTLIKAGLPGDSNDTYTIGNTNYQQINSHNNPYLECQITISPAPTNATSLLHLLAVSKADLLAETGLAGSSPKYRFLRWNTNNQPASWDEAFGIGPVTGSSDAYWPKVPIDSTNPLSGQCAPNNAISVATPQVVKNAAPQTTSTLLNTISGRCLGDVCAAFTYGMVNSIKKGSDFLASDVSWPGSPFPSNTTYIGALTTAQYFQLLGSQKQNNGKLPVGANSRTLNNILRYDPYNDLGVNQAQSNCYFSGFSDRFGSSGFGGIFNPNPTFLMDLTNPQSNKLSLGNVPGTITNKTVIVITLHPIPTHPTITTIMHDVNQSGSTDSVDLSLVLLAIGVCPLAPETCPEDVNKDGVVDNTDVGLVLLHFGSN